MRFTDRQIGEGLHALRRRIGQSAAEVADRAGLVPAALLKVEKGETSLSAAQLCAVLDAMEADLMTLQCVLQGVSLEESLAVKAVIGRLLRGTAG